MGGFSCCKRRRTPASKAESPAASFISAILTGYKLTSLTVFHVIVFIWVYKVSFVNVIILCCCYLQISGSHMSPCRNKKMFRTPYFSQPGSPTDI